MGVTLVLLLCLSLPINGTNWREDLGGWSAADWSVLALLGSVINVGTNLTMQRERRGRAAAAAAGADTDARCSSGAPLPGSVQSHTPPPPPLSPLLPRIPPCMQTPSGSWGLPQWPCLLACAWCAPWCCPRLFWAPQQSRPLCRWALEVEAPVRVG